MVPRSAPSRPTRRTANTVPPTAVCRGVPGRRLRGVPAHVTIGAGRLRPSQGFPGWPQTTMCRSCRRPSAVRKPPHSGPWRLDRPLPRSRPDHAAWKVPPIVPPPFGVTPPFSPFIPLPGQDAISYSHPSTLRATWHGDDPDLGQGVSTTSSGRCRTATPPNESRRFRRKSTSGHRPVDDVWALCLDLVGPTRFTGRNACDRGAGPRIAAVPDRYRVLMQVGSTIGGVIVTEHRAARTRLGHVRR